jgi:hypothetical protein
MYYYTIDSFPKYQPICSSLTMKYFNCKYNDTIVIKSSKIKVSHCEKSHNMAYKTDKIKGEYNRGIVHTL